MVLNNRVSHKTIWESADWEKLSSIWDQLQAIAIQCNSMRFNAIVCMHYLLCAVVKRIGAHLTRDHVLESRHTFVRAIRWVCLMCRLISINELQVQTVSDVSVSRRMMERKASGVRRPFGGHSSPAFSHHWHRPMGFALQCHRCQSMPVRDTKKDNTMNKSGA